MANNKILIYCPVFLPQNNGYTHAFVGLINNLLINGFCVDVLTPYVLPNKQEEVLHHPKLQVIRYNPELNIWGIGLFYHFKKLAQKVVSLNRKNNYQIIFIETGDGPLLTYFLPNKILDKTVIRFHSTSDTEYLNFGVHKKYKLRKWFWKHFSGKKIKHLCATNAYHLNYAAQHVLYNNNCVTNTVVTNAVQLSSNALSVSSNSLKFFMLGRMDEEGFKQKGFELILKVLPLIADEMLATNASFTIVGNGKMHTYFYENSKSYPFVKVIEQLSHEEVLYYLQNNDVVVLPSIYEGVSMFALEAIANKNAVIFSKTGGLIDMVDGNGILIEANNVEQLTNAFKQLLKTPNLSVLKEKSGVIAANKFSADVQLIQFKKLLQEVNDAK